MRHKIATDSLAPQDNAARIRDVRARLAEVVERADRDDVPTVITRRGKEVAAVVSIEVLREYLEWEEREINQIIDERTANPAPGVPIEEPESPGPIQHGDDEGGRTRQRPTPF
ncbi:type II toxin-antitoxin system Phd/YefM family antitoxin [Streptomyces sp. NRRL S-241]|uniref:type II toxin-antitoxin system Phd/YefM family antitoxin n=1 Tax=Streptomyces sp. NRRL S-241 TaxID=1463896 RepID=UPI001F2856F9|nr:type II toxin-antitoxin system Phd/YefM family antitoxin [Streptomyces sp. NRRL S-241]